MQINPKRGRLRNLDTSSAKLSGQAWTVAPKHCVKPFSCGCPASSLLVAEQGLPGQQQSWVLARAPA